MINMPFIHRVHEPVKRRVRIVGTDIEIIMLSFPFENKFAIECLSPAGWRLLILCGEQSFAEHDERDRQVMEWQATDPKWQRFVDSKLKNIPYRV